MSKSQHSVKSPRRNLLLTAKEKRLVKHAKKHSNDATTFCTKQSHWSLIERTSAIVSMHLKVLCGATLFQVASW